MSVVNWRNWLRWAILVVPCLAGCRSFFAPQGPPHDPLFRNKTPIAAKAVYAPPVAFAYLEPTPPHDPFPRQAPLLVDKESPKVPGTLTNRPGDGE